MPTSLSEIPSELSILRRVVERNYASFSKEAARAMLRLDFDGDDRKRMNFLAAKNRAGKLSAMEEQELDNFIHVGQVLGILKSRARRALKENGSPKRTP